MVKENSQRIEKLKKKSRRDSIREGIFASGRVSFGDSFVQPFAIAINASNPIVALIPSISGLFGPISQIFGSSLIEKHSRRKILTKVTFYEAFSWIPLILVAFLFYKGIIVNALPLLLLLFFAIFVILANMGTPAWFSWTGDLIDDKKRGRWLSKRNLIGGFVAAVLAIAAGFFLDYFKQSGKIMFGFIILFSLAIFSRLMCWRIFKKQYEPKIKISKKDYFSFWEFTAKARKNNFGKLSIFRFLFTGVCAISSPLLPIYLLRNLNFSYSIYMIIIITGTLLSLLSLRFWGIFIDKYGSYRALIISTLIIQIIPILWIIHKSPIYLALVPATLSGLSWAGLHLSENNFIYDNVRKEKRGIALSYYNVFWGLGVFLGAGLGALLIKFLTISIVEPIIIIFLIGTFLRMLIVFFWIPKMKEIRRTGKLNKKSIKRFIVKQGRPTITEEFHEIVSIKDYIRR
ncbi:MAG: MFS transporter [Nanoarchaeota archaeon]|nr:MFS transporter [Nanoarchaeota archaeon]